MNLKHFKSSGISLLSLLFLCTLFPPKSLSQSQVITTDVSNPVEGDLKILAVMAEFQPDENPYTSGNGTFEEGSVPFLENPGTNIDALPHDQNYFEAHLEFVKNYFEKMSAGKLDVEYHVAPGIVRLPKQMEDYSPTGPDPDLSILSELTRDVWESLSDANLELPDGFSSENTAFVIFHAGIGRDIELTGTTLNRTPQDIPSLYLSRSALAEMFNDPSFSGFPVQNGELLVSNSLIVPRTLSRAGEDVGGNTFVLPLSINGMLTAQIGSHLGLPDLFNTENGQSGIGRFGLMDGAGIFAYNGLFPPEMSAWEKIYLGWADPFEISTNTDNVINIPAASLRQPQSIARINQSTDEYYLVENRHRDPDNVGVTLSIQKSDGSVVEQQFSNRDETFVRQSQGFDELLEPGVVINVSNLDFSLPGGFDEGNDRNLNGGLLIWHVDESIIRQKIEDNKVNNNDNRRGISLVEADGAQDIGRPVSAGLFQNPANGSPFDFWWSGNNSTVITETGEITLYENRFGPDTTPVNRSHSGSLAPFELSDFSDNLPTASFSIKPVDAHSDLYTLIESRSDLEIQTYTPADENYFKNYPLSLFPVELNGEQSLALPGYNGVQIFDLAERELSENLSTSNTIQQPLFHSSTGQFIAASAPEQSVENITLQVFEYDGADWQLVEDESLPSNHGLISITEPGFIELDGISYRYDLQQNQIISVEDNVIFRTETAGGVSAEFTDQNFQIVSSAGIQSFPIFKEQPYERLFAGLIDRDSGPPSFYLLDQNDLNLFTSKNDYEAAIQISKNSQIERPAILDLSGDGNPDFLFVSKSDGQIHAVNSNGALIDFFPLSPPPGVSFTGTPLVADLNGNDELNILVSGTDESSLNLYGYDLNGELMNGFPVLVGGYSGPFQNIINPVIFENYVAAVSPSGDFKLWQFPELKDIQGIRVWKQWK